MRCADYRNRSDTCQGKLRASQVKSSECGDPYAAEGLGRPSMPPARGVRGKVYGEQAAAGGFDGECGAVAEGIAVGTGERRVGLINIDLPRFAHLTGHMDRVRVIVAFPPGEVVVSQRLLRRSGGLFRRKTCGSSSIGGSRVEPPRGEPGSEIAVGPEAQRR